ncbi:MAG: flagellar hook-basal body protein [Bacillota bacterium]
MIRGIYTSASGMRAEMFRQEVTANNMANATTPGFKRDFALLQCYPQMELYETRSANPNHGALGLVSTGVVVGGEYADLSGGVLQPTGRKLDVALVEANTYIAASRGSTTVYLRTASLRVDPSGYLVTSSGERLQDSTGSPIRVGKEAELRVDEYGNIVTDQGHSIRLRLVRFPNPAGLQKVEGGAVVETASSGSPVQTESKVLTGYLEGSNTSPVKEMVELIAVMRAYEANQRAIHAQDETLDKVVNELGRA